jgi:Ran GTPase-activating protein (RanGAP) involved in mRNA processing and transport
MDKKALNWEQLVNDGENYGGKGELSPHEKIVFESIKDNRLLKIQDSFLFSKRGKVEDNHGINLATLIAGFEPLKDITTLILTHNQLGPEGLQIIVNSKIISKIEYLHLGSNGLGDEGAKIIANAEMFSEVHTLNLECNGIQEEGAIALANSPYLTKLTSLNMVDNRAGDNGALAIANSDTLSNLTYLHLGGNRVKSEEVKKALRESPKLTHLETLKVF